MALQARSNNLTAVRRRQVQGAIVSSLKVPALRALVLGLGHRYLFSFEQLVGDRAVVGRETSDRASGTERLTTRDTLWRDPALSVEGTPHVPTLA